MRSGLICLVAACMFASCHPPQSKNTQRSEGTLSMQDSLLAAQFPLPEHLAMQKELLLAHSKPLKRVIRPDGKDLEGEFGSGAITLLLDEIDGEPQYLYGHLPDSDVRMEFILYRISSSKLDALQPGQRYRLHWIESVVGTQPFDDDRYRLFVVWRVEGV